MVQTRLQREGEDDVRGPDEEVRGVVAERGRGVRLEWIK